METPGHSNPPTPKHYVAEEVDTFFIQYGSSKFPRLDDNCYMANHPEERRKDADDKKKSKKSASETTSEDKAKKKEKKKDVGDKKKKKEKDADDKKKDQKGRRRRDKTAAACNIAVPEEPQIASTDRDEDFCTDHDEDSTPVLSGAECSPDVLPRVPEALQPPQ